MRANEKIYISDAYKLITTLALVMHLIFISIFVFLHMAEMFLYNAAAIVFYSFFLWLMSKGHYRLAVTLIHLEVCSFVVISTLYLGWHYGFAFYLIAMTSLVYFNPFNRKKTIYFLPFCEIIIFFLLYHFTSTHDPYLSTSHKTATLFEYINFFGCFTIILVGAFVSKVALKAVQKERDMFAYDALTGIYRREHFIHCVEAVLNKNPNKKYIIFLTDIIGFKFFNEIFGDDMGDEVLKAQADILRQGTDRFICFGRVSGDQFAVLMNEDKFNEKLLVENADILQKRFSNDVYRLYIHAGIYRVLKEDTVTIMLDKAVMAIRSMKGKYGTCYAYYTNEMLENSLHERRVLGEFEQALEEGQFCFYLQPQISKEGTCSGAEALVRWNHPIRGLVFPGDFIPVLESTGIIWKLDVYIWEEAVKKLKDWQCSRNIKTPISVNISAKDFFYLDIYEVFTSLVEKYDISPKLLNLEITETAFFDDMNKQLKVIGQLQEYGFQIEIDDFGSGFSSLNILKDIRANTLKLDMAFLDETENTNRSWAILNSIIDLAGKIGMETISEGVETQEQMTKLKQLGCDMFQGYYFSKPIPVEDFEEKFL